MEELLGALLGIALIVLVVLAVWLVKLRAERVERARSLALLQQEHAAMLDRFRGVVDVDSERQRVLAQLEADRARLQGEITQARAQREQAQQELQNQLDQGKAELAALQAGIAKLRAEQCALDEESNLQSFGFYRPRYDFSSSDQYQRKLEQIRDEQKKMLKNKSAAICRTVWTVNGSAAEGRKQISQTLKLILRAFNGESDAAIAKVSYKNVNVMESRIKKSWEAINGLVEVQSCEITKAYLDLKLQELYLAHEYQEKVQAEKEEQRRIREQMREEEIARREIEKARQEAEREEQRYEEALRKAQEEVEKAAGAKQQKLLSQIEALQKKLEEAHANKERAVSRAQMTRSGHVYVISNIGSFGEHVYKIGMTRRLDPHERVRELGDASVPFEFDVHAMIYSDDAPALEAALHRAFHERRINLVNEKKEFFQVEIDEIARTVRAMHGEIEITRVAEAEQYRKTVAMRQERQAAQQASAPGRLVPQAHPAAAYVPA